MRIKIAVLYSIACIFTSFSCQRSVTKQELYDYINDESNCLTYTNLMHGIQYRITYKPADLVDSKVFREESLGADCIYFILQASFNNNDLFLTKKTEYDYNELLKRFSFELTDYVYGVYDKKDTLPALQCVFTRNYATTGSTSAMLIFKKRKEFESFKIVFKDIVFDSGDYAKFNYTHEKINKTPKLTADEKNGKSNG